MADSSSLAGASAELGVAFIGGGMVSDLHQAAIRATPGLRLVGVYDAQVEVTRKRADAWQVQGYASLAQLLDDDRVQVAYVLTPPEAHVATAKECLERGRHVFVEKPVSYDPAEVETLLTASSATGRVAMAGHNYAYIPEFQRIVRMAREGGLGIIRSVWINYAIKHPEWVAAAYGGVLEEVMIHHTYLALALLGAPEHIHAGLHEPAWEKHKVEDQAWMAWEYPGGASAFMFASFAADDNSADPWTFMVKVLGTEGSATMSWRSVIFSNRTTSWFSMGFPLYEESYAHESRALHQAITSGAPAISSLADAATSARLLTAAYEAARGHKVVSQVANGSGRW
jgi:predicted dehydrogenase